jgi:hypothetical protein
MKPYLWPIICTLTGLLSPPFALGQDKSVPAGEVNEQKIAQIQKLLDETLIETKDLQEKTPLTKFLVALESQLPKDKKIALYLDKEPFGADLPRIMQAEVWLLHFAKPGTTSLRSALHTLLKQLPKDVDVDYGIRADGIVLTRPHLAAHRWVYDVRDIVKEMPSLVADSSWLSSAGFQDIQPSDGPALLARLVSNSLELRPWETIEVLNGTRLALWATPARHEELGDLMRALHRLMDTAVVMNARLFEVDRAFYAKEVAPLFAKAKDGGERPTILSIDAVLFKKIAQMKAFLESEDTNIRPHRDAVFLSQQSVFRYVADLPPARQENDLPRVGPEKATSAATGTGLAGVSFRVRARVSPDRRYLRLRVSQDVAQLVGIDKTKTLDSSTGIEVQIEVPNLRKTTVTGTVQILDGNPILMPVDYRPREKGKEDKVWLLVARPFIWIQEEMLERLRDGENLTPQDIWDSDVQADDEAAPPVPAQRLPRDDDTKEILQAIITDVLTHPGRKQERELIGTRKKKMLALVDTGKLGWPKDFQPATHGYKLVQLKFDPFATRRRVLGIRLDKFDLKQKESDPNAPIEICLFDAGGTTIGGYWVSYTAKRVGMKWVVECFERLDP